MSLQNVCFGSTWPEEHDTCLKPPKREINDHIMEWNWKKDKEAYPCCIMGPKERQIAAFMWFCFDNHRQVVKLGFLIFNFKEKLRKSFYCTKHLLEKLKQEVPCAKFKINHDPVALCTDITIII